MTAQQIAAREAPGQLAAASPIDTFEILDAISGKLIAPRQQQPTLATISAGYNSNTTGSGFMKPVVSRDGTIYVDGRPDLVQAFEKVNGLARALQANDRKRLTITFPFDDPALFIQQRFSRYSSSALELYGDENGITRIKLVERQVTNKQTGEIRTVSDPVHEFHRAGTEAFEQLLPYVKTSISVYFLLAEWDGEQARVVMPDGLGIYRLRMTSRNSIHNIVNSLKWVAKLTNGRFAGVPFDLWHQNQEVVGPDGKKHNVPIWQIVPKPPKTIALTSANFQRIFKDALRQGDELRMLPAPMETAEAAMLEGPESDLDTDDPGESTAGPSVTPEQQAAFNAAMRGGLCDPARARRRFFGDFGDTVLNDDGPRAAMMREFTKGTYSSLGAYLADCTEGEASNLHAFAKLWLARKAEAGRPRRVIEGRSAPMQSVAPATPAAAPEKPAEHQEAVAESVAAAEPMLPGLAGEMEDPAATGRTEQPGDQIWEDEPEPPDVDLDDVLPARSDDEDLDLLSLHVQRREALERARTPQELEMAWHDCTRDADLLGKARTMLLTKSYEARKNALAQDGSKR